MVSIAVLITKRDIDEAVARRDIAKLTSFIREDLSAGVREYLATIMADLLTGKVRFRRGRPPKAGAKIFEQQRIAEEVWQLKHSKQWKKTSAAIKRIAEESGKCEREIWNCWAGFEDYKKQLQLEKINFDVMADFAHEGEQAMREDAIEWLSEQGERPTDRTGC